MNEVTAGMTCPNCGAPVTSEICQYCGCTTGLDTNSANMDYPTLDCKEANLGFWTVTFPLLFMFTFGFGGTMVLYMGLFGPDIEDRVMLILFSLPFLAVGIGSAVAVIRPILNYFTIKKNGKYIEGTVYGYMDDNILLNHRPAQIVKILVDTPNGRRFVLYQLGDTVHPYAVNSTVGLWVYKDKFMIDKKKETVNW